MHEPVGPVQSPAPMPQAATGKPFTVAFDGVMLSGTIAITSVKDIDRLMKVLQAQKAAFEAMQGDDYDDREGGPSAERPN